MTKFFLIFLLTAGTLLTIFAKYSFPAFQTTDNISWKHAFPSEKINPDLGKIFFLDTYVLFNSHTGKNSIINRKSGELIWDFSSLGFSLFTPAIKNQMLYYSGFDGVIYAVNTDAKQIVWRFTTPDYIKADTPIVISNDIVAFGSRNGKLYAINSQTGKLKWTFQTAEIDKTASTEKIIIHFGQLSADNNYFYVNSATDNALYAFDHQGNIVWKIPSYGYVYQEFTLYGSTFTHWDNFGNYTIRDKQTGRILYSTKSNYEDIVKGESSIYVKDAKSLTRVNVTTGKTMWTILNANQQITTLYEPFPSILLMANLTEGTAIHNIDVNTGKVKNIMQLNTKDPITTIRTLGEYIICLSKTTVYIMTTNEFLWKKYIISDEKYFITEKGLYFVAKNGEITLRDIKSGTLIWQYQNPDMIYSSISEYKGDIYFLTRNTNSLSRVGYHLDQQMFTFQIFVNQITKRGNDLFQLYKPNEKNHTLEDISYNRNPVQKNTLFEITISGIDNSNNIYSIFSKDEETKTIHSFSFVDGTKKIRFVPEKIGDWKWRLYNNGTVIKSDILTVVDKGKKSFLKISNDNPKQFIDEHNAIVPLVGIQNCVEDTFHDGSYTFIWPKNDMLQPIEQGSSFSTTSLQNYLQTLSESGFNFFRWGDGNCSFNIWKQFAPNNNQYALLESMKLDSIFSELKNNNYHIMMSLFSFSLPFDSKQFSKEEKNKMLIEYVNYVIARYASLIDIWELTNEIHLDNETITLLSAYIKEHDPYHHPITTNWEKPEIDSIDITSLHWYRPICYSTCYDELVRIQKPYKKYAKPIIVSEKGNDTQNWDLLSATRMRVDQWLGFVDQLTYIYWNTNNQMYKKNTGASNIYIGPTERTYLRIFSEFIPKKYSYFSPTTLFTRGEEKIKAAYLDTTLFGYIFRNINFTQSKTAEISFPSPIHGVIIWVNPTTGDSISQLIKAPTQSIITPEFSVDIAFRIDQVNSHHIANWANVRSSVFTNYSYPEPPIKTSPACVYENLQAHTSELLFPIPSVFFCE